MSSLLTRTAAWTIAELKQMTIWVKKTDRGANDKERRKTYERATEALSRKFYTMSMTPDTAQEAGEHRAPDQLLCNTYDLERLVTLLSDRLYDFDMIDVTLVYRLKWNDPEERPTQVGDKLDVLKDYENLTLEDCVKWNQALKMYGEDIEKESLSWWKDFMVNSSESVLINCVSETYDKLPPED